MDISVNPVAAADLVFDISGNRSRANRAAADAERWRIFDAQTSARDKRKYWEEHYKTQRREDNYIQRRVKDAQAAGISPLAALGASPYSPANISMPDTMQHGGRASGTSFVNTISSDIAQIQLRQAKAATKKQEAEAVSAETQAMNDLVKIGIVEPDIDYLGVPEVLPPVNAMQHYYDRNGGMFEWLDPEFAESLDSFGGLMYMGLREAYKNIKNFWDDSKYYLNEMSQPGYHQNLGKETRKKWGWE